MQVLTEEIPRDSWAAFFEGLAEHHTGWLATIEVMREELGDQLLIEGKPLQGISFEARGSESGDILIAAGDSPAARVLHHVDRPQKVLVADVKPGVQKAIEIESDDGTRTLISLRAAGDLPSKTPG